MCTRDSTRASKNTKLGDHYNANKGGLKTRKKCKQEQTGHYFFQKIVKQSTVFFPVVTVVFIDTFNKKLIFSSTVLITFNILWLWWCFVVFCCGGWKMLNDGKCLFPVVTVWVKWAFKSLVIVLTWFWSCWLVGGWLAWRGGDSRLLILFQITI